MTSLRHCHSIADVRRRARRVLPRPIFDYMDGGADDEMTLSRNTAAFDDMRLSPRCLVDVSRSQTRARVLGREVSFPLICAPTGASRFYHPEGERAVARAAAGVGIPYALSTMATTSLEDVAAIGPAPRIFQLYVFKDKGLSLDLIARAQSAGYDALCLTVDASVRGKRERELRSGMGVPLRLTPASIAQFALRPLWLAGQVQKGSMSMANIAPYVHANSLAAQTRFVGSQLAQDVTWRDAEQLIAAWNGPFAIKGVMNAQDATHAVKIGASTIIVSNHGGRQLDGAPSPLEALPAIAEAIQARAEIILDGGVRRGTHILKALALGAAACSIGRPYLYGLAAGGEAGVVHALTILHDEFARAMKLCGFNSVAEIATRQFT
jgi:L-lactate dehydrogenase (cytochrome)